MLALTGACGEAARLCAPEALPEHALLALCAGPGGAGDALRAALAASAGGSDGLRRAVEARSPLAALSPLERLLRQRPGLPPAPGPALARCLRAAAAAAETPGGGSGGGGAARPAAAPLASPEDLLAALLADADVRSALSAAGGGGAEAVAEALRAGRDAAAADAARRAREPVGAGAPLRAAARPGAPAKSMLAACGTDLTAAAEAGLLDPVLGRDAELATLLRVLVRRRKCNPVLLGGASSAPRNGWRPVVVGGATRQSPDLALAFVSPFLFLSPPRLALLLGLCCCRPGGGQDRAGGGPRAAVGCGQRAAPPERLPGGEPQPGVARGGHQVQGRLRGPPEEGARRVRRGQAHHPVPGRGAGMGRGNGKINEW